ncbi:hypothetical protein BH10ACT3_BH10ACT3_19090 [soil metagenome]
MSTARHTRGVPQDHATHEHSPLEHGHSHADDEHGHSHDEESGEDPASIDELMTTLRERGQRATTARRAVLEQLLAAGETHLTADELARRVSDDHPAIHLSTIYRTLDSLDEAGLISPARFADSPVTYHLTGNVHHHAVCSNCGTVLRLPSELFEPVSSRLLNEFGFHADPHHMIISGLCRDCASG